MTTPLQRVLFSYAFLCGMLLLLPFSAHAAELSFSPASGSFASGAEFAVKVLVQPGTDSINAADGAIGFDKDLLSVVGISKDGSAFSLWTAEPAFSNSGGTINFSGGTPTAFAKEGTVVTITFKGKKPGSATLSFTKGSILAADGKGTDVYTQGGTANLTITEAAAEPEAEEDIGISAAGGAEGILPLAPVINSNTHSKADSWYATTTAQFTWKLPPDAAAVRTLLSADENAKPTENQKADAVSQTKAGIADGVWYFFVQVRNDFGWGEIGKRKVQIDTIAPKDFDITLGENAEGVPKFMFKTEDELSGVDRYEIIFGSSTVATVRAQDLIDGAPVPPQEGGERMVVIKAYDRANNIAVAQKQLTLPKVAKPSAKGSGEAEAPPTWTWERILLIIFALAIGAMGTMMVQSQKIIQQERATILNAVLALREKNDKVFGAMREEFEQLINDFDERPQLTPEERALLEDIKEVLEISEEVVDSSIEELKKRVRGQ